MLSQHLTDEPLAQEFQHIDALSPLPQTSPAFLFPFQPGMQRYSPPYWNILDQSENKLQLHQAVATPQFWKFYQSLSATNYPVLLNTVS